MLIRHCNELQLIDRSDMIRCLKHISSEEVHCHIRNLIMMVLLPKQLHLDSSNQAAYLRAAVSRVSQCRITFCWITSTQIANQTVMEPRGLDLLLPIWQLMQPQGLHFIGVTSAQVRVSYTKYVNNFKRSLQPGEKSISEAVADQLTPVGSVMFNKSPHAMVLDTLSADESFFIFKNSHGNNKKFKVPVRCGPDEFYFIHVEPTVWNYSIVKNKIRN